MSRRGADEKRADRGLVFSSGSSVKERERGSDLCVRSCAGDGSRRDYDCDQGEKIAFHTDEMFSRR